MVYRQYDCFCASVGSAIGLLLRLNQIQSLWYSVPHSKNSCKLSSGIQLYYPCLDADLAPEIGVEKPTIEEGVILR